MIEYAPAVSVVVPAYNAARTLDRTIQSLLALDYPADRRELILVDNASTDATSAILAGYGAHVRVVREPKRGRSAARNLGIREARHPLIAFTDADCIVDPQWLRSLVAPLADAQVGVSGGPILAVRPCSAAAEYGEDLHDQESAITKYVPPYAVFANSASRRDVLLQIDGFDEALPRSEDADLGYRLGQAGYRIVYQHDAIVYHHNHPGLGGLFREGLQHGFYSVLVLKKHRASFEKRGHRRVRLARYRVIPQSVARLLRPNADGRALFDATYNTGRLLGRIGGSIRFRYLSI